jgi:hypothetical protein
MRRYLFTIFADRRSPASREPVSDIHTAVVDSLKALDPERPIRDAANAPQQLEYLFNQISGVIEPMTAPSAT